MKLFIKAATALLLITAVGKIAFAFTDNQLLKQMDPLLSFMTNRQVLFVTAAVEIGVVSLILKNRTEFGRLALLAWISTAFALYRIGLWLIGYTGPCKCLGQVSNAFGLSSDATDIVTKVLLGLLLTGSYYYLGVSYCVWRRQTTKISPDESIAKRG